jgi:hypothetical protein
MKRAAFQKHQGSGRRRKRLDSSGHRILIPYSPDLSVATNPDLSGRAALILQWLLESIGSAGQTLHIARATQCQLVKAKEPFPAIQADLRLVPVSE